MGCRCRKLCYFLVSLLIIVLLILAAVWKISTTATHAKIQKRLNVIDQDPTHWIGNQPDKQLISPEQQAQMAQSFIHLYFSAWQNDELSNQINAKVMKDMKSDIDTYSHKKAYMFTSLPFTSSQMDKLIENIDMTGFPQINRPAIITHATSLRIFPTLLPGYISPNSYPFDYWVATYLAPATPIKVLQRSKDQSWYWVRTASASGWIPADDVAFADPEFVTEWQKHPFIVTVKDGAMPGLRKGTIYPKVGEDANTVNILFPYRDENANAHTTTLPANKNEVLDFPIPATAKNIAEMAKTFINEPYGWGGLYGLHDCSSTVADILAGFAVWLPRNSTQQSFLGTKVPLTGTNISQRRKVILTQGVPFLSLVHMPGHVTLYIGSKNGNPYVEQEAPSIHTKNALGGEERIIIGKTVISSLDLGKNFSNIPEQQIQRVTSINIYDKAESYANEQEILKKVWRIN